MAATCYRRSVLCPDIVYTDKSTLAWTQNPLFSVLTLVVAGILRAPYCGSNRIFLSMFSFLFFFFVRALLHASVQK